MGGGWLPIAQSWRRFFRVSPGRVMWVLFVLNFGCLSPHYLISWSFSTSIFEIVIVVLIYSFILTFLNILNCRLQIENNKAIINNEKVRHNGWWMKNKRYINLFLKWLFIHNYIKRYGSHPNWIQKSTL